MPAKSVRPCAPWPCPSETPGADRLIPRAKGTPEGSVRAVGASVRRVMVRLTDMITIVRGVLSTKQMWATFLPSNKSRSCPWHFSSFEGSGSRGAATEITNQVGSHYDLKQRVGKIETRERTKPDRRFDREDENESGTNESYKKEGEIISTEMATEKI